MKELDKLREICEAAEDRLIVCDHAHSTDRYAVKAGPNRHTYATMFFDNREDAEFMVAARTALPALLDYVCKLIIADQHGDAEPSIAIMQAHDAALGDLRAALKELDK